MSKHESDVSFYMKTSTAFLYHIKNEDVTIPIGTYLTDIIGQNIYLDTKVRRKIQ